MDKELIMYIAKACHEANRVWCQANGDYSEVHWAEAQQWQRDSIIKGVEFRLDNPDSTPKMQHKEWMADRLSKGWIYGEKKDEVKKTNPYLVPWDEMPEIQKKKDKLFYAIIDILKDGL